MRGKRKDLPSSKDAMAEMLRGAFERVRDGKPNNSELARLNSEGRLKLTVVNVATEAGVSRTLIGHEGCRYPEIRSAILNSKSPTMSSTNMRSINNDLRLINRELERRVGAAETEQAALLIRMRDLETEYVKKNEEISRIKARDGRDPNHTAGLKIISNKINN